MPLFRHKRGPNALGASQGLQIQSQQLNSAPASAWPRWLSPPSRACISHHVLKAFSRSENPLKGRYEGGTLGISFRLLLLILLALAEPSGEIDFRRNKTSPHLYSRFWASLICLSLGLSSTSSTYSIQKQYGDIFYYAISYHIISSYIICHIIYIYDISYKPLL